MNKTSNESFGSNPSLSTKTPEINSKTEVTTEKVVIKNTNFIDKGYGLKGIVGEIANTDTAKHTVTLKATFYDTAGKIKGTGIGSVSDLAPAETKTFDIYTSDDITGYATFKVQVDSLF